MTKIKSTERRINHDMMINLAECKWLTVNVGPINALILLYSFIINNKLRGDNQLKVMRSQ